MGPLSLHVPQDEPTNSVTTLRQFPKDHTALLSDLTKARPFTRTEMILKARDGGQLLSGLF
jgi:hypothetical protein